MRIRVSATRMELLKLRQRLALAVRGHHLLKDKQDELVRQFFLRQEEYRTHLRELWRALAAAGRSRALLRSAAPAHAVSLACQSAVPFPALEKGRARVMNLSVPVFRVPAFHPLPLAGALEAAGPLEDLLRDQAALLPLLVRKAELERAMATILDEVEVTKRRVNALEYKLIPTLRDSIASIAAKLSELELSTLTRLMRVKEIIEQDLPAPGAGGGGTSGGVATA